MDTVIVITGIILIAIILIFVVRAIYRKRIAKVSSKLLKEMGGHGGEIGIPTIRDLQALADYLRGLKEGKEKREDDNDENNRGMYI